MILAKLLAALLMAGLTLPAAGHDLWIERDGKGYVLLQGHRHSAHQGAEIAPYEPATVKSLLCADTGGTAKTLPPGAAYPVRIGTDCAALFAVLSSGYWTKTAWETKNVAKPGIGGVVKSWLSEETVKRIERWSPALAKPVSEQIEITPLADPLKLAPGDKLAVRVSFAGKPRAGVPVAYDGDVRGATTEDGSVSIRIRRAGMQMLSASLEEPLADGKADTVIRTATLVFELPER
jgi:nickel transport protein